MAMAIRAAPGGVFFLPFAGDPDVDRLDLPFVLFISNSLYLGLVEMAISDPGAYNLAARSRVTTR